MSRSALRWTCCLCTVHTLPEGPIVSPRSDCTAWWGVLAETQKTWWSSGLWRHQPPLTAMSNCVAHARRCRTWHVDIICVYTLLTIMLNMYVDYTMYVGGCLDAMAVMTDPGDSQWIWHHVNSVCVYTLLTIMLNVYVDYTMYVGGCLNATAVNDGPRGLSVNMTSCEHCLCIYITDPNAECIM